MRTYINKQGLRVTNTRIITEEFKKANENFRHFDLMKVTDRIINIEKGERNISFTSEKVELPTQSNFSIDNHIILSEYKKYENSKSTERMFEFDEYGFITLISELSTPKLKEVARALYIIRQKFINEFFTLRAENTQLKKQIHELTKQELNEIALPDTIGKKSVVNGEKRNDWVRGYGRSKNGSKKNAKKVIGVQKSLFDL